MIVALPCRTLSYLPPSRLPSTRPSPRVHVPMREYTLTHLSDAVLLRDLAALVARDRLTTATLLAHIAEVDARRLYVPAGYPSMHAYCVDELHLSEDAASKRIHAARAARRFPVLFTALAEGRFHLAAVCLLAPHLTPENVDELIEIATHRRKSEIEELLAGRFPLSGLQLSELPAKIRPIATMTYEQQHAPGHVERDVSTPIATPDEHAVGHVGHPTPPPLAQPPSVDRFLVQLTIPKSTHDKLRHAQALLSHAIPNGDMAQVLDRALDALIHKLERQKIGVACRPRRQHDNVHPDPKVRNHYVPAHVRRAVWERDQGQCTFVSKRGGRCKARRFLEFDHIDPVARGGKAIVDRMRLRCRAHNQYEAERVFGAGFMARKRLEGRRPVADQHSRDVLAGLRNLGCPVNEARRAVEISEAHHGATLEERMRLALKFLRRTGSP